MQQTSAGWTDHPYGQACDLLYDMALTGSTTAAPNFSSP